MKLGNQGYEMNSDMFTAGISNSYTLESKTFVRTVMAISRRKYHNESYGNTGSLETPIDRDLEYWHNRLYGKRLYYSEPENQCQA